MSRTNDTRKHTLNLTGELHTQTMLQVSMPGLEGKIPRNGPSHDNSAAPYFPASSIRGPIRHAMHRVVVRTVNQTESEDDRLRLEHHYMLSQGQDITGEVVKEKPGGQIDFYDALRNANPALSLGGRWKLAGNLGVFAAFPEAGVRALATVPSSVRTDPFDRRPELADELSERDFDRLAKIAVEMADVAEKNNALKEQQRKLKAEARKAEGEDKQKVYQQIGALEQQIIENKEEKSEAKESIKRLNDELEVIAKDQTLEHRMRLTRVGDIELGLFLATLREFAREPYLGGKKAYDFGRVSGRYSVTEWLPDDMAPTTVGTIEFDDDGFRVTGELLKNALTQWDEIIKLSPEKVGLDFKRYL